MVTYQPQSSSPFQILYLAVGDTLELRTASDSTGTLRRLTLCLDLTGWEY